MKLANRIINIIASLIILISLIIPSAVARELTAKVLSNNDGDTLTVIIDGRKEKIRLLGMDTPEIAQGFWGKEAQKYTEKLTTGKEIMLETDVQERDQFGRLLAYVFIDGQFLNLLLIQAGYAQLLTYSPNVKYVDVFTAAQTQARNSGEGIWGANGLKKSPYEFRHGGKKQKTDYSLLKKKKNTLTPSNTTTTGNTILVHVNSRSGVYHYPGCEAYNCHNCSIVLTEAEALKHGYRRHTGE